jgi:signal peptidase I
MSESREQSEKLPIPSFLGVVVFVVGMFLLLYGNRYISPREWVWYTGIILSGLGIVLWIFSGMTRSQAIEWTKQGSLALLFALAFRWAVAEPYRIPSGSMQPTLDGHEGIGRGDRVFVNKWIYGVRYPFMNKRIWYGEAPQRWDMVVFKSVEENPLHSTLVKRIVGMPGEHIQIRGGQVYVDGAPLDVPDFMPADQFYTSGPGMLFGVRPEEEFAQIPEEHYLVLGDNSGHSRDGRYFGWLPNEHIVGRVASIWWPPRHWRDFTGFSQTWWWKTLIVVLVVWILTRLFLGRSWPYHRVGAPRRDHLAISFLHQGFRIPFTRLWLAQWGRPERGDLVLYHPPKNSRLPSDALLAGRIAALPRERVVIANGQLSINGERPLDAPAVADMVLQDAQGEGVYGYGRAKDYTLVPDEHFFILSEEDESGAHDSRSLGWVPKHLIVGKSVGVWWPLGRSRE